MAYTGTLIEDLAATCDVVYDAAMMAEAIQDLDQFGVFSRPCWDMEPMMERERR